MAKFTIVQSTRMKAKERLCLAPLLLLKVNGVKCRAQLDTGASFIGEMASFRTAHIAVY